MKRVYYSIAALTVAALLAAMILSSTSNPATSLAGRINTEAIALADGKTASIPLGPLALRGCLQPAYVSEPDFRKLTGLDSPDFKVGDSINVTGIHTSDSNGKVSAAYIDSNEVRLDPWLVRHGLCVEAPKTISLKRSGQFVFISKSQEE